ncbi:MAG: YdcF family protein [Alphaproteobacteria bacterium]|nr:MAG: YdcF family protein [Alphaproteobacteria bacterium]
MSGILSIISPFILASNLIFAVLLFGAILSVVLPGRKFGRRLLQISVSALLLIGLLPLHIWLFEPLENRFPIPELPDRLTGIIVMGDAGNPRITEARGQISILSQAERMIVGASLAKAHPEAKLLYSGGKWKSSDRLSEAEIAGQLYRDLGIPSDQILLETKARNTFENALFTYDLVKPTETETWVLVTSASHMPRSVGVFRRIQWEVIPYPVDYQTYDGQPLFTLNVSHNIRMFDHAARAWMSLAAYYLLDRINTILPGPKG